MTEPYYIRIKDVHEFLRHYLSIYEGDYGKTRAEKIISLFPRLRGKMVLDVGCGGGYYSIAAYKKGCKDIMLLDVSPVCVKAAKLNLLKNFVLSSKSIVEGMIADATHLPFRNECFDFVLCIDLIEHVKRDDLLLHEIRRVLRDKALMLIATQNSNSINYLLEAPIQRYVLKNRSWMGWDPTHLRFYTRKLLTRLLSNCGFNPIKVAGTYFIPYLMATWLKQKTLSKVLYYTLKQVNDKLERKQGRLWSSFGWGIICLCIKSRTLDQN